MKLSYVLLFAILAVIPLLFLMSKKLAVIYALVLADKMLVGLFKPFRFLGLELTTLASVLAAIYYGPVAAFFAILILFTVLQSLRYLIIPISVPDWPLFVPNRDAAIYAAGAFVAGLLPFDFFGLVMSCILAKYVLYGAYSLMTGKYPQLLAFVGTLLIHVALLIPFGLRLRAWLG